MMTKGLGGECQLPCLIQATMTRVIKGDGMKHCLLPPALKWAAAHLGGESKHLRQESGEAQAGPSGTFRLSAQLGMSADLPGWSPACSGRGPPTLQPPTAPAHWGF